MKNPFDLLIGKPDTRKRTCEFEDISIGIIQTEI